MKKSFILSALLLTTVFVFNVKADTVMEPEGVHPCAKQPASMCDANEKPFTGTVTEKVNGVLRGTSVFKDGQQNGVVKTFYPNGKVETEANFKAGKQDGIAKSYWDNGNLKAEITFVNGKQNGAIKAYRKDGSLMAEGTQKEGVPQGAQKTYYKNG